MGRIFYYNIIRGENMDELILTFSKEQLKLYNELSKQENIELDFETEILPFDKPAVCDFDDTLAKIRAEADSLLKFRKQTSLLSVFLTQEEIKELIPFYYNSIRNIKRYSEIIGAESFKLSFKLGEINKIIADINKRYSDFLPYKAALSSREEYSSQIDLIDKEFKSSIDKADSLKKELLSIFERAEKLTDVVSDFIKSSSKATDEPKFKKFDAYDFFWSVEAFMEQIKNI